MDRKITPKQAVFRIRLGMLLALALIALGLVLAARAAEGPSIELSYDIESRPEPGAAFSAYKVRSDAGAWIADISGLDEASSGFPRSLLGIIQSKGTKADASGTTGKDGKLFLALPGRGTYLIAGAPIERDGTRYTPTPILMEIAKDAAYSLAMKHTAEEIRKPSPLRALVIWDDEDYAGRPDYVVVDLLDGGTVRDSARIGKEDNWRHTWDDPGEGKSWWVAERGVPEEYRIAVRREGATFAITNYYREKKNTGIGGGTHYRPEKPDDPAKPPDVSVGQEDPKDPDVPVIQIVPEDPGPVPEIPVVPIDPADPVDPEEPLPQTGVEWGAVVAWAFFGVCFLGVALVLRRQKAVPVVQAACVALCGAMLACSGVHIYHNADEDKEAGRQAEAVSEKIEAIAEKSRHGIGSAPGSVPDYELDPDRALPVADIRGVGYVGMIRIPAAGVDLPVAAEWSYTQLKHTPCLYDGTGYGDDLVVMGHNYKSHFAGVLDVAVGDEVSFTDMDGNEFNYTVDRIDELRSGDRDKMVESGYPLSVFTCKPGGTKRVTLRCVPIDGEEDGTKGADVE